jgi:hypothetical protein
MKKDGKILEKAVKALKNEQVPPGPPQELSDATSAKLAEASGEPHAETISRRIRMVERLKTAKGLTKVAAAAVLLIVAGYAASRLATPPPPDVEQLRAAIEPDIRNRLLDEMKQYVQLGLTNGYIQIKDDLSQQYRQDLSRFAIQTLAASNAVTNELLTELIESINTAQAQDLRRIAAALEQMELNRLYDKTELVSDLETLAYQTEDELQRTRQDMVRFLANTQPDNPDPNRLRDVNNSNERSEK